MGVRISLPVQIKKNKMAKFSEYIAETKNELLNKVSWPTWQELQGSAVVVLISSVIIALIVFLMDLGFENLMKAAYSLVS
jgi:preprotein translocase subunit SecE